MCLGTPQQTFRFNPNQVHDIYAYENKLVIEIIINDRYIEPYEFGYIELDDLWADFRTISDFLTDINTSPPEKGSQ